jgi:hypothetical protein
MPSLEIAVFEAVDADGFARKQEDLHRALASLFDGYVGSLGLRSVSEPSVYADLVLWESATAARVAADAIGDKEELAWFQREIAGIRFFDHLSPAAHAQATLTTIGEAPVVELVLVKPAASADEFGAAHEALHVELAASEVVVGELRLELNDKGVAGDVNGWADVEAMEEMGPIMMARPEFGPVFDQENELVLFMPFVTNYAS